MRRAAILAFLAGAHGASAHTLDTATARVSLRDGHLEVVGEWDLFLLATRTPTEVATATETDLEATHVSLRRAIEAGTSARVDGHAYALDVTGFPSPNELRAMGATLSAAGNDHGVLARVRLESRAAVVRAEALDVGFPAALGPVLASFVQPSTVFVPPGARALFPILTAAPPSGDHGREPRGAAWLAGAALAVVVAAFTHVFTRRRVA